MWWLVLSLQFLVKLRFPANESTSGVIIRRYGRATWHNVRKWEKNLKKWEKAKLDVIFLERCVMYGLTPKFVRFRLYKRHLQERQFYKEWQSHLLQNELNTKRKLVDRFKSELLDSYNAVKNVMFFLDFNHILHYIHKNVNSYKDQISITHAHKLYNLGAFYKPPNVDPDTVITNLSNRVLTRKEKWLLSFGLEHCLIPKCPKFEFSLYLESLLDRLSSHPTAFNLGFEKLIGDVKTLHNNALSFFNRTCKFDISLFNDSDLEALKKLKKDENTIICRPDKGRGVVIMDKTDYISKMNDVLDDNTTFRKTPHNNPLKHNLLLEDRLNRFLKKLLDKRYINETEYRNMYAVRSKPSIIYGLPKSTKSTSVPKV